ncbi:RNA polymerase sigma factor [Nocardiopsis halotolerans]|uniref:RNA polymerase sigma factor n=1 Tax=Nocardiopsis halotolerans TaxID=124252 RepID=UPI0003454A62|nr:sigma-70 family RNA polymerase sigma factor [Nocardiopsis halotolerans]
MSTDHVPGDRDGPPDETEFRRFFTRHYRAVYDYAWRRVGPSMADDVASEALVVAWRRFHELPDRPLPWLYGCARRIVMAKARQARARDEAFGAFDDERLAQAGTDTADAVVLRESALGALATLNPAERELVMLVTWEGLNSREAARVIGCTHAAARVRLYRARRRIEAHLSGDGAENAHTGTAGTGRAAGAGVPTSGTTVEGTR